MIGSPRGQTHFAEGVIGSSLGGFGADDEDEIAHGVVLAIADGVFDATVEFADASLYFGHGVEAPGKIGSVAGISGGVVGRHDTEALDTGESVSLVARIQGV